MNWKLTADLRIVCPHCKKEREPTLDSLKFEAITVVVCYNCQQGFVVSFLDYLKAEVR